MFNEKNIELDEKQSTKRSKIYLLKDDKGKIKLFLTVYRNPMIDAVTFTFQCVDSYGLIPEISILPDRTALSYGPNTFTSTVLSDTFDQFIEDTLFAREAATYVIEHMDEL